MSRRSRARRSAAWVLAVAGPVGVGSGLLPFRPSVGLAGLLFALLLADVAIAVAGGVGPALGGILVGFLVAALLFAPPYGSVRITRTGDLVAVIGFVLVGAAVGIVVDALARLADEQAALRRVATLAAGGAPQDEVYAAVVREVARLVPAEAVQMCRYESDGTVVILAGWTRDGGPVLPTTRTALGGKNLMTAVAETGRPARMDSYADATGPLSDGARSAGLRASVGAPIVVDGRLWGVMVAASALRRLPRGGEVHLAELTDLIATTIANAESRGQLAASRARVVAAADETRRRIERDLHDGTQQTLVALGLELRALETMVPDSLSEVRAQLSRTATGLADALNDLQKISRGIHPAVLTRGGLAPAIKTLARRCPVPVELELGVDRRLPEGVEVAAYYIVAEALTNAAKHAKASVVHVDLTTQGAAIKLSIRDDGVGGANPARGTGLVGLRDRVETVGGSIEIRSTPGAGTTLLVRIPTG